MPRAASHRHHICASLGIGGVMHREGADWLPVLPQTISLTPRANL